MHNFINSINWEHVVMVIMSIFAAFGASLGALKKFCKKIENTKDDTEAIRIDIEAHKLEIQMLVNELKEMINQKKGE